MGTPPLIAFLLSNTAFLLQLMYIHITKQAANLHVAILKYKQLTLQASTQSLVIQLERCLNNTQHLCARVYFSMWICQYLTNIISSPSCIHDVNVAPVLLGTLQSIQIHTRTNLWILNTGIRNTGLRYSPCKLTSTQFLSSRLSLTTD